MKTFVNFVQYLLLMAVVFLGIVIVHRVFAPLPFTISQTEYLAKSFNVCENNQVVEWSSALTVNQTPAILQFFTTVVSEKTHLTVIPDNTTNSIVWTDAVKGMTLTNDAKFKIPKPLPLGDYEIRRGITSVNSPSSAAYIVKFRIVECSE